MDHADEYLNCEGTESTPLDIEIWNIDLKKTWFLIT